MSVKVTEGMRHGDVFVLTQTELDRLVNNATRECRREIRALRDRLRKWAARYPELPEPVARIRPYRPYVPQTDVAVEARRDTYRRAHVKKYARYNSLLVFFGESHRKPWTTHLKELDRRFAESVKVAA